MGRGQNGILSNSLVKGVIDTRISKVCPKHSTVICITMSDGRVRCPVCMTEWRRNRRIRQRQWIVDKFGGQCSRCGYEPIEALEFHHIDPRSKNKTINQLLGYKREIILQEAAKCILLCANCHAEEGAQKNRVPTGRMSNKRRKRMISIAGDCCCLCGYDRCGKALDFHHLLPEQKKFEISGNGIVQSELKVFIEARECILVCRNCHRSIHSKKSSSTSISHRIATDLMGYRNTTY